MDKKDFDRLCRSRHKTFASVANELGCSERTLRRKIEGDGLSIAQVEFLVGYFGMTPDEGQKFFFSGKRHLRMKKISLTITAK